MEFWFGSCAQALLEVRNFFSFKVNSFEIPTRFFFSALLILFSSPSFLHLFLRLNSRCYKNKWKCVLALCFGSINQCWGLDCETYLTFSFLSLFPIDFNLGFLHISMASCIKAGCYSFALKKLISKVRICITETFFPFDRKKNF